MTKNRDNEIAINVVLRPDVELERIQFDTFDEDTEDIIFGTINRCALGICQIWQMSFFVMTNYDGA